MNSTPATNTANPTKRIAIAIDLNFVVPWHYDCCEGVLQYGREQGWSCTVDPFLLAPGSPEPTDAYDGVVGRIDQEVAEVARLRGIPMVNHWVSSPVKDLPSIGVDIRAGARMAGEHLVACGYRRLCYLDLEDVVSIPSALEGLGWAGPRRMRGLRRLACASLIGRLGPASAGRRSVAYWTRSIAGWRG